MNFEGGVNARHLVCMMPTVTPLSGETMDWASSAGGAPFLPQMACTILVQHRVRLTTQLSGSIVFFVYCIIIKK